VVGVDSFLCCRKPLISSRNCMETGMITTDAKDHTHTHARARARASDGSLTFCY
jgi:hypothetical protein